MLFSYLNSRSLLFQMCLYGFLYYTFLSVLLLVLCDGLPVFLLTHIFYIDSYLFSLSVLSSFYSFNKFLLQSVILLFITSISNGFLKLFFLLLVLLYQDYSHKTLSLFFLCFLCVILFLVFKLGDCLSFIVSMLLFAYLLLETFFWLFPYVLYKQSISLSLFQKVCDTFLFSILCTVSCFLS